MAICDFQVWWIWVQLFLIRCHDQFFVYFILIVKKKIQKEIDFHPVFFAVPLSTCSVFDEFITSVTTIKLIACLTGGTNAIFVAKK